MQVQQSQLYMSSSHRLEAKHSETEAQVHSGGLDAQQALQAERIMSTRRNDSNLTYSFPVSSVTEQSVVSAEVRLSDKDRFTLALIADISKTDGFEAPQREVTPQDVLKVDHLVPLDLVNLENFLGFGTTTLTIAALPAGAQGERNSNEDMLKVRMRTYEENERSSVNIRASLAMDDGRQFNVSIDQSMERHYKESAFEVLSHDAVFIDPLVINFNGASAALNSQRVQFDLNSDGQAESIATLSKNSAYIALDRNGDGKINNGLELFGAQSGKGFAELAQFDDDKNGFIDQGDLVYSQLSAYRPGDSFQSSFSELGIVAVSLNSVDSPFRLTDEQNQTLGQVRATSFYVTDDGRANTVQQIDLAV